MVISGLLVHNSTVDVIYSKIDRQVDKLMEGQTHRQKDGQTTSNTVDVRTRQTDPLKTLE